MARWFRSHASKLDNPKVQRLSDAHYRAWDSLLCIACRYGGTLPPIADVAFLLRKSEPVAAKLIETLVGVGLFVKTERGIEPHQWNEWQYKSDVSTERVKQHRERQRNVSCNVPCNVSETASETEADTDTESETEREDGAQAREAVNQAFRLFNDAAKRTGWPEAQKIDDKRRKRMMARLKEVGMDGFAAALARAEASDFLTVKWPLKIDWLLLPGNFTKVIEGNYANPPPAESREDVRAREVREAIERSRLQ